MKALLSSLLLIIIKFTTQFNLASGFFIPYQTSKANLFTSIDRKSAFYNSRKMTSPILASSSTSAVEEESTFPTKEELEKLLSVAIDASKKAGDIIIGNAGGAEVEKCKANTRDLLTLIDPLCEKTIRDCVLETFPTHDFLGEEDVPPGKEESAKAIDAKLNSLKTSDFLWIVDPIDGTTNFVHGMPLCMPSVAVAYKGEVVVGVIFDPHQNEVFSAMKNHGAFLNGKPIQTGQQTEIGDAVIAMGSPPGEESMQMSLKGVEALMPKCRTIRMIGSAAIMFAWVACGRLTVYWEYDLSSWDVSAGFLLVTEAGGKFTGLNNEPWDLRQRKIMASCGNGNVHEEVLRALNEAGVQ